MKILLLSIVFLFILTATFLFMHNLTETNKNTLNNYLNKILNDNEHKIILCSYSQVPKFVINVIFSFSLFLFVLSLFHHLSKNLQFIIFMLLINISILYGIFIFLKLRKFLILTNYKIIEVYIKHKDIKILKTYNIDNVEHVEYDFFIKPSIILYFKNNTKEYVVGYANSKNVINYINKQ